MGQPVAVQQLNSTRPGIVRFETNRVLTGTANEHYTSGEPIYGNRPPDVLARELLGLHDSIKSLSINSSIITVELAHGADPAEIAETIANLYIYYRPGVEPPVIETGEA